MARFSLLALASAVLTTSASFVHPGLLVTDADIARAASKIAVQADPWYQSWNTLTGLSYASADYVPNAVANLSRDTNGENLWHDAAAAFNLALRWRISGNDSFADAAARVLTNWSSTLVAVTGSGDDDFLSAGLQGYELANAAELLRTYTPFVESGGLAAVQTMMETKFLPLNMFFLYHLDGSEHNVLHFFANWELAQLATVQAIAVLTENQTAWDFATDYLYSGIGNGCINNAISNLVEEPGSPATLLGQGQESGRDQGHSALDHQLLGVVAQQAWNQGEDVYGFNDSRILRGIEYFARYNLGNDVPFVNYTNGIVSYSEISSASRGSVRPTWELFYAHYVQIKGEEAPWTVEYLNYTLDYFGGAEGGAGSWGEGSGHYDGLGWGSLLYHLDPADINSTSVVSSAASASSVTSAIAASTTSATSATSAITASFDTFVTSVTSVSSVAAATSTALASSSASVTSSTTAETPRITAVRGASRTKTSSCKAQGNHSH
ncbi:hypothetical protein SCUCBS95973_002888 [Sporothrix curviconia]|uniref:Alginate lyase domain-containing protein n=1 Tax=Sporothrix curviconia TaxID=1260050 RepID=A0ABP0BAT6_9PEZI